MLSIKIVEEATQYMMVRKQIVELPDKAGFHVRRWISHQPEVVEEIPEQNQVAEINISKREFKTTTEQHSSGELNTGRTGDNSTRYRRRTV